MKDLTNIVFGLHPVIEAINAGKQIDKILVQRGAKDVLAKIKPLLEKSGLLPQHVPVEKLNRVTRNNHQGIIAYLSPIPLLDMEEFIPAILEKVEMPLFIILDRVTDVRNFGAIARTAECAGVDAIIVPERGRAMIGPDAIKTSAGALFKIPVCTSKSLKQACFYLQQSGIKLVGCTEKAEQSQYDIDFAQPVAIIMGSEEDGISKEILRTADHLAKIPMNSDIDSLNVSVAAGIMLYEALRQRM